jgi:hypothetical protein
LLRPSRIGGDKLIDLLTVQTMLRNQMYKTTYGTNEIDASSISNSLYSPILLDKATCVPKYSGEGENIIIGNESHSQCKALGGEMVYNVDNSTKATISYYSGLDQDITDIKESELYNPVNSELVPIEELPEPNISTEPPTPTPKPNLIIKQIPTHAEINKLYALMDEYTTTNNLINFVSILILVLGILWGGYYYYNKV